MRETDRSPGGLSRRQLLRGGLGAAAAIGLGGGLSGCGSTLSAGVVGSQLSPETVVYWNLFGGGDGARMQSMEAQYTDQHGPRSLQAATFAWGNPYYTKVSLATLGDAPPDVAVAHLTRQSNLALAGLLEEITDDMLSLGGISASDFAPKVWEALLVGGKRYAIPIDTHPFVLYYNKDICQKAGLLDGNGLLKPITGTEQWEAALTAAKKVTGAYGASVATVADNATPWRWFQSLYSQQKGSTPWLSEGGRVLSYNEDLTLKTMEYIQSLTKRGLMPASTDYSGSQTLMFTGQSAFYLQGEWEITTAEDVPGLKFGMTPVPVLFDQPASQGDSHTFVIPRSAKRNPEQLQRAMGYVKSLLDQSLTWAKGGHIPAYLPTLKSPEYAQLKPQSDYASAVESVVYDAQAWYSGSGSNFENTVGSQLGLVLQGIASPKDALATARAQLETYAKTESPL